MKPKFEKKKSSNKLTKSKPIPACNIHKWQLNIVLFFLITLYDNYESVKCIAHLLGISV